MSLPQRTEGRWVFRAGFLTPGSALEGACKLTLKLLHAVCVPGNLLPSLLPIPLLQGDTLEVFCSPFVFMLQDFHRIQGSFVSLGALAALIKCYTCVYLCRVR